ncbi:MAG: ABC transporter ATP-binding protein, partial [Candidatus Omnitrophica bacterium]|nr:ABC transporter ATP-binding protein [Candidatus Omnitrophota bacterium]
MLESYFQVKSLTKRYRLRGKTYESGKYFTAVSDVSFRLTPGKTLGLIGESGSGKSTIAKMCAGLTQPDCGIFHLGNDPVEFSDPETRKRIQIIFQNPMTSLNPRMSVRASLLEPQKVAGLTTPSKPDDVTGQMLEQVGLPAYFADKYPHMLSGGECQRVAIARVLGLKPSVLILDEVVSALDVLVRAQVLNLLLELQEKYNIAYLFISHDLSVVRHMSDDLAVLNRGEIVESGTASEVL